MNIYKYIQILFVFWYFLYLFLYLYICIFIYTNTLIYKSKNIQTQEFSSIQIWKYSNLQKYKWDKTLSLQANTLNCIFAYQTREPHIWLNINSDYQQYFEYCSRNQQNLWYHPVSQNCWQFLGRVRDVTEKLDCRWLLGREDCIIGAKRRQEALLELDQEKFKKDFDNLRQQTFSIEDCIIRAKRHR